MNRTFWVPNSHSASQLHAFNGIRRLNAVFTRALQGSLTSIRSIQSTPSHHISLRSMVISSSHFRLGHVSGLFLSGFPTKIFYAFFISLMHATCPAHLRFLDLNALIIFGEAYGLGSSSLCSLLQFPAFPPFYVLSTLISNILHLCSSVSVRLSFTPMKETYFNL
jgi:hypothetical protein